MAAYTITTNTSANEETALQYVVGLYNASQVAANPAFIPLTAAQYLKQIVLNPAITSYKQQYKDKLKLDAANTVAFD